MRWRWLSDWSVQGLAVASAKKSEPQRAHRHVHEHSLPHQHQRVQSWARPSPLRGVLECLGVVWLMGGEREGRRLVGRDSRAGPRQQPGPSACFSSPAVQKFRRLLRRRRGSCPRHQLRTALTCSQRRSTRTRYSVQPRHAQRAPLLAWVVVVELGVSALRPVVANRHTHAEPTSNWIARRQIVREVAKANAVNTPCSTSASEAPPLGTMSGALHTRRNKELSSGSSFACIRRAGCAGALAAACRAHGRAHAYSHSHTQRTRHF